MRNLVATMFNSSGFSKRKVSPNQIMTLPLIDIKRKVIKKRVSKDFIKRALEILNN